MKIKNPITKYINKIRLNYLQKENDALYKKEGLTDEVLDKQIAINKKRHELDIVDEKELTESNKGFVQ